MRRVDVLIALAIVAAAAGSAVGLATYHEKSRLEVTFQESTAPFLADPQARDGPGDLDFEIEVPAYNLTHVVAHVSLSGASFRTGAVAVTITVTGPGLAPVEVEATLPEGGPATAEVPVEVHVADMPASYHEVVHRSGELLQDAPEPSTVGRGTWTVRVTFAASAVPLPASYAAGVQLEARTYAAVVGPYVPEAL